MDIRNVTTNGSVERSSDRTKKSDAQRTVVIPSVARDQANISSVGRDSAAAVEGLAERARTAGGREAIVTEALRKLTSGELDGERTIRATAQRVLDAKFLAG